MKNVLIVEQNTDLTGSLELAFEKHKSQIKLFVSEDGAEAINTLEKMPISVVVTDLHMPKVDGLELLAYMSRFHPATPVIMATISTSEVMNALENLGVYHLLKKPYSPDELVKVVTKAIDEATGGNSTGHLSTSSFLEILQVEQRSCSLTTINQDGQKGIIYLIDGRIYDAESDDLQGDDAAIDILRWEQVTLDLEKLLNEDIEARIHLSLKALISKAASLPKESKPAKKSPQKKVLRKEDLAKMLLQAVNSAESGNLEFAHGILGKILKIYPKSGKTWLWFARTSDNLKTLNLSLTNAHTISPKDSEIANDIKKTKSAINSGIVESSKLKHCPFCWAPVSEENANCHYCFSHLDIQEDFFQSIFFGSQKDPDLKLIKNSLHRLTKAAASKHKNVNTHFYLAMAHVNLNHWDEALEELKNTKNIAPKNNPYQKQLEIMTDFIDDLGSFYEG